MKKIITALAVLLGLFLTHQPVMAISYLECGVIAAYTSKFYTSFPGKGVPREKITAILHKNLKDPSFDKDEIYLMLEVMPMAYASSSSSDAYDRMLASECRGF